MYHGHALIDIEFTILAFMYSLHASQLSHSGTCAAYGAYDSVRFKVRDYNFEKHSSTEPAMTCHFHCAMLHCAEVLEHLAWHASLASSVQNIMERGS